jgi:hypothetical protein
VDEGEHEECEWFVRRVEDRKGVLGETNFFFFFSFYFILYIFLLLPKSMYSVHDLHHALLTNHIKCRCRRWTRVLFESRRKVTAKAGAQEAGAKAKGQQVCAAWLGILVKTERAKHWPESSTG